MTKRAITPIAALVVLLSVAGVAAARAGYFSDPPQPDRTGSPPAAAPTDELRRHYGIFRREAQVGDGRGVDDPTARSFGADPARARHATTTTSGAAVFLTPGIDGLCIGTSRAGNVTCGSTDAAVAGRVLVSVIYGGIPADTIHVYGAVPDGITQVSVQRRDGSSVALPVKDNVYVLETSKRSSLPSTVAWKSAGATTTISAAVPADAGETVCAVPGAS
jgi:hypothetical protein